MVKNIEQMTNAITKMKSEFLSVNSDSKGNYVFGMKSDFNYVKECAKTELSIHIEHISSSLQNDDSIRHYFLILD